MDADQFKIFLPVIKPWLSKQLKSDPDRDEKLMDAISVAWEIMQTAPDTVTPLNVAYYALKSVRDQRHQKESSRSISSPKRKRAKPQRATLDPAFCARPNDDPAKIAGLRIDFASWLADLNDRQRRIVKLLVMGNTTQEVAELLGCTDGNVSQYRRRLAESWYSR